MYVMKQIQYFCYKLVQIYQDKESISMLRDHKVLKSQQIKKFLTFEKNHASEYSGLDYELLKVPKQCSSLLGNEFIIKIWQKKIKKARNLLYLQKNKLQDTLYKLKQRFSYLERKNYNLKDARKIDGECNGI